MAYLRIHSLDLPRDMKRMLATELTQTVVEARHLHGVERDLCTIHFATFAPEDLSIGGKLIANGRAPDFQVEYRDHDLTSSDKKKLAHRITDTMARVLGLAGGDVMRVSVLFVEYDTRDFSIGGTLLRHMWKRGVGRLLGRMTGVIRRRRRRPAPVRVRTPAPETDLPGLPS
jgi:phenylpyruvate tautomerase PptA (4-oxalocrotonate tautomerase family)